MNRQVGRTVSGYRFEHLSRLRAGRSPNQKGFATLAGLAKGTVVKIERGEPVFASKLERYCGALGIDAASLFETPLEFSAEHPLQILVTRGVALRPAREPKVDRPAWKLSPIVVIVSNLVFRASAEARGPIYIEGVELASDTFGELFQEPMNWTHWVSLDNGKRKATGRAEDQSWLGLVSRFGKGSTITGLTLLPGTDDQNEVLFTRNSSQQWREFVRDVHLGLLDDHSITMKLRATYRYLDTRKTAQCTFSLRSADCRNAVKKWWGVDPFRIPRHMQIELVESVT